MTILTKEKMSNAACLEQLISQKLNMKIVYEENSL